MDAFPQMPVTEDDLWSNTSRRVPAVILADRSGSMTDDGKLDQMNDGLKVFAEQILQDPMAKKSADIMLTSFGPVQLEQPFSAIDQFEMPRLECGGGTPMGEAVDFALNLLDDRKAQYKTNNLSDPYTPWVWLITDGEPTDKWQAAAGRLKSLDAARKVMSFVVGVDGADMGCLANFSARPPVKLKDARFAEMFDYLSSALSSVASSRPGDKISLPDPETQGWGEFTA